MTISTASQKIDGGFGICKFFFIILVIEQAGAELCQAQTSLGQLHTGFGQLAQAEAVYSARLYLFCQLLLSDKLSQVSWVAGLNEKEVSSVYIANPKPELY